MRLRLMHLGGAGLFKFSHNNSVAVIADERVGLPWLVVAAEKIAEVEFQILSYFWSFGR